MDDQRCSLKVMGAAVGSTASQVAAGDRKPLQMNNQQNILPKENNRHQLLEMIADLQSERMDEQRAALPGLVGNQATAAVAAATQQPKRERKAGEPDDAFLDMLMRCQGSRLEEQRSELPKPNAMLDAEGPERKSSVIGATVPDEDFFSLISRVQGGRMEDQRAAIPLRRYQNGAAAAATAVVSGNSNGRTEGSANASNASTSSGGDSTTTKNGTASK